jgi:DNA-binding CsgD family transcriptional regulator
MTWHSREMHAASLARDHEMTTAEIAAKLGLSPQTVARYLRRLGIAAPNMAHQERQARERRAAALAQRRHMHDAQIARELGLSLRTVRRYLRRRGIHCPGERERRRLDALRLLRAGHRDLSVATATGVTLRTVQRYRHGLGLPPGQGYGTV